MKKPYSRFILVVLIIASFMSACNNAPKAPFVLTGTLEGITDGKAILTNIENDEIVSDTALIKKGRFVFTGDITEPEMYALSVEGAESMTLFYAENSKMIITGRVDSLRTAVITGGRVNDDFRSYNAARDSLQKKFGLDLLMKKLTAARDSSATYTDEIMEQITALGVEYKKDLEVISENFIRSHPGSYFSIVLLEGLSYGKSADEIEKALGLLDPSLSEYEKVQDLYRLVDNLRNTDLSSDSFVTEAENIAYKTDITFSGGDHKDVIYLASLPGDKVCGLKRDGSVIIIDGKGARTGGFATNLKSQPSAVAVNPATGQIYVLGTINEITKKVVRGKEYEISTPLGVECIIYDQNGKQTGSLEVKDLKTATGAKIVNGKLIVADYANKMVAVLNAETGALESSVKDLRVCCGILDFSINADNELLIANLGAFRVMGADFSGNTKFAFGQRGPSIDDFHGCCNPVNVAYLSNGALVTVEKDPTRIKVYSKTGAIQIAGIEELVKGCKYIPMAVDSQDNIYLASARNGLVKCVPNS